VLASYSKMRGVMIKVRRRVEGAELLSSFLEGDEEMSELVRVGQSIDAEPVAGCPRETLVDDTDSLPDQIGYTPVETSVT
jgi:hypothetical protein